MAAAISYQEDKHNTISAIVDHVMFKKTLHESMWQWMLEMGLWHLRELKLDVWQDLKTLYLPVTDRKTIILPQNFVDYTKIGAKIGQYAVTISVNDKLNLLDRDPNSTDFVNGLLSQNLPNGLDFNSYGGYYFFNYNGSNLSCAGTGFVTKGSFRIHEEKNFKELLIDYDFPFTHIYIEYITDGFDPCGETMVDPYFADYVKKGIEFTWEEEKNPARTEASIRRKGTDFADAKRLVRARKNDLSPQDVLNISRAAVRFTPHI